MEILPDSLSKAVALVNKNIATFDQKIVLFEFSMDNKSHYIHYNTTATLMNMYVSKNLYYSLNTKIVYKFLF